MKDFDFVLASGSPRRAALLRQIGLDFRVEPSRVEEVFTDSPPEQNVVRLSEEKARDVASKYPDSIVIGADTVVVIGEQVLGKPGSQHEAAEMLTLLSGQTHTVFTGFCLFRNSDEKLVADYERTLVTFRAVSPTEIKEYIATGSPMDKAGAYGIQDFGAVFVERIEGCYYTIMGLPASKLYSALVATFGPRAGSANGRNK